MKLYKKESCLGLQVIGPDISVELAKKSAFLTHFFKMYPKLILNIKIRFERYHLEIVLIHFLFSEIEFVI